MSECHSPTARSGHPRLEGKVILVTGSTTGIGEGMARIFVQEGAKVIIHGRRREAAAALAAELGSNASSVVGPLEDPQVPERLIQETIRHFGRIDGLVNNAALMTRGNIEETDIATFDLTIAVDLRAPFLLIRAVLPYFRRQGGGRILNIGSVNAYCGERNMVAYSVCKGGLATLTRNLADTHGAQGVRVNQLNVGWTLTPNEFSRKVQDGLPSDWPSRIDPIDAPSGRLMMPEDVAWAAVYFLSDEAPLVNGSILDLEQFPVIGRNPPKEASGNRT